MIWRYSLGIAYLWARSHDWRNAPNGQSSIGREQMLFVGAALTSVGISLALFMAQSQYST